MSSSGLLKSSWDKICSIMLSGAKQYEEPPTWRRGRSILYTIKSYIESNLSLLKDTIIESNQMNSNFYKIDRQNRQSTNSLIYVRWIFIIFMTFTVKERLVPKRTREYLKYQIIHASINTTVTELDYYAICFAIYRTQCLCSVRLLD